MLGAGVFVIRVGPLLGDGIGDASFESGGLSVVAKWYACEAADGQLEVALASCCENSSPHSTKA